MFYRFSLWLTIAQALVAIDTCTIHSFTEGSKAGLIISYMLHVNNTGGHLCQKTLC